MRLTLTPDQITSVAKKLGAPTNLTTDVVSVIHAFNGTHDPFSRKDIAAVLVGMGHKADMLSQPSVYEEVTRAISANSSPTGSRGFYTQLGGQEKAEAPVKVADVNVPVPPVDEETPIILEICPVEGVSFRDLNLVDSVGDVDEGVAASAALYNEDLHLRRLAMLKAPCYGEGFAHSAPECKRCPLSSKCAVESFSRIDDLVERMDKISQAQRDSVVAEEQKRQKLLRQRQEEEARLAAFRAGGSTNLPLHMDASIITGEEAQSRVNAKYPGRSSSVITLPFEGICGHCGQPLKAKTFAVQLPQMTGYPTHGIFHLSCALTREPTK